MNTGNNITVILIFSIATGIMLVLYFVPLGLWLSAILSGVRISFVDLIMMRLRKIPQNDIVSTMIMAAKGGVEVSKDELETHYLAGGRIENVVTGLIFAKNKDLDISFKEACQMDLARKNIVNELSGTINTKHNAN